MSSFKEQLESIRQQAEEENARRSAEEREKVDRVVKRDELVNAAARMIEDHIELRVYEFNQEFVEFRYETHVNRGRHFRLWWDEPGNSNRKESQLHQLALRVRRYHEYADVEVEIKMIVANAEMVRRSREEDVFDGEPEILKEFIDQQICSFTRLYLERRGW